MLLEILDFIVDFMGEHTFLAVLISVILYLLFKGLRLHIQTKPQADYAAWCAENTDKELRKEFEKLVELSNQNPEKKDGRLALERRMYIHRTCIQRQKKSKSFPTDGVQRVY